MQKLDRFYIDGQWVAPQPTRMQAAYKEAADEGTPYKTIEVINPATEKPCLDMACAGEADVIAAISAARAAFPAWSQTPPEERARFLRAMADGMTARLEDLIDAHVICMGIPRHQAVDFQITAAIEGMRYYADRCASVDDVTHSGAVTILREPIGVCVLISPWNYPLLQMTGKMAPALAAGCTVITKPAEQTPLPDMIMAEIGDEIGLPKGVFNMVTGIGAEIGEILCGHEEVDMVSFTGSTASGIKVAQAAAPTVKRVCQELGGKSALIITEDADLEAAIRFGVENVMLMGGQTCDAYSRMLVPQSRYEAAITLAKSVAQAQIVGDPDAPDTTIGPLASLPHRARVLGYIKTGIDEGARLVTGGVERPDGCARGAYVAPTIFADVTPDMVIAREEIFGPVLCMIPYGSLDEAVRIANDTRYGLSSAVFAKDDHAALEIAKRLRAGQCYIQGGSFSLEAPFGGYKQSGNGREWADAGLAEYLEIKAVISGGGTGL